MTKPNRIPLFPLDVVLFPTMPLPLHIFEPRYKVMVRHCLEEDIEFGMVLATTEGIASVGCTVRIVKKIKEYPDGRMDILSEGRLVFRLVELLNEEEYHEGVIEYLSDQLSAFDLEKERHLVELFERCHLLLFGQNWAEAVDGETGQLAYRMASRLPVDLPDRQRLLEMRSETNRREFLDHWMAKFLPEFARQQQARRRAGGNGHALN